MFLKKALPATPNLSSLVRKKVSEKHLAKTFDKNILKSFKETFGKCFDQPLHQV